MTEIKIKKLVLENFKCHKSLRLDFEGGSASVYGDNATGKTSIYDALTWLLFGKDSQGNGEKNIEIKPLDKNGDVADHQATTSVEAILQVNGEEVTLRRTYQEVWTTKRGSSEPTYDGNTSEYFVDGVPCKKFAFQDKVDSIVDADTFLMLTSVSFFANDLPWVKRREILFDISGVVADRDIMATNSKFAPLAEAMGKLTLEDYKARLLAQKKGFVGTRNEVPARINECQKTVDDLVGLDYAGAKADVASLQARSEQLSGELISIEHNSAADVKRMDLREAQLELDKLETENDTYRKSQQQNGPDISSIKNNLRFAENRVASAKERIKDLEGEVKLQDKRITDCREQWMAVSGETFSGASCPTCGQSLPADQLKASKEKFEANKNSRLHRIEQDADNAKKGKAVAEEAIARGNEYIAEAEKDVAELTAQLQAAQSHTVVVSDMEDYQRRKDGIQRWIAQLQDELHRLSQDAYAAGESLRKELAEVKNAIAEKNAIIAKESTLEYARSRIDALRQEAASAAEKLAEIEKFLFLIDEYSRYKTGFVEDTVNGLFRIARFRLFREQANGGVEDRCDVTYQGVPYISLNSGAKINVGIDIINTLSAKYGVRVPLFVDNAESVTQLEKCGSQIIRLVVSENDKELRVNYAEN